MMEIIRAGEGMGEYIRWKI